MKWLVLVIAFWSFCFYSMDSKADEVKFYWMAEAGFSVHDEKRDAPEFQGRNPMGTYGVGGQWQFEDLVQIEIAYRHDSSIPDIEKGYGYNRWEFKFRKLW